MPDEKDGKESPTDSSANEKRCEESKCLSSGLMPAATAISNNNPLLFNCYAQGPGTLYPYLCADDYIGVRIAEDDVSTSTYPDLHYYTCCPPGDDIKKVLPMRECEDPQEAYTAEAKSKHWTPTATCQANSPSYPIGRKTTHIPGFPEAYMCCSIDISPPLDTYPSDDDECEGVADSTMLNNTLVNPSDDFEGEGITDSSIGEDDLGDNPLEDLGSSLNLSEPNECYSFPCHSCVVENSFGDLQAMNCFNDVFKYPQVIATEGNTATYQCCSLPQATNSPFVITSAYRATVWTQFTLAFIASSMASLLIVSISRSLFLAKKNSSANTTRRRVNGPDYSTYNMYLVLLAIPDLAYNLFMLGIVTEHFFNGWIPVNNALITLTASTNQYMNAVIAREVLVLLRRTKDRQRYVPPSFKKAGIQFGIVTAFATALGILWMCLLHYFTSTSSGRTVRATVAIPQEKFSIPVFYSLVVILPAAYLLWVCFEIWQKELLPKSKGFLGESDSSGTSSGYIQYPSLSNIVGSFRKKISSRFIDITAASTVWDSRDNTATSNLAESTPNTNEAAVNSVPNASPDATTPTTTIAIAKGCLNVLAMYFMRVILVFYFLWLPGMIMYYIGYQTVRNGLPHNLALICFSLQAIVSNGIALIKPDVKKSIYDLWDEATKLCCCYNTSFKKSPVKWPERDVEVPIHEEPYERRRSDSNSNSSTSRIVTVHHEIANIGGIQVSQLTTHTISSFASVSSRVGGSDGDSDTENYEHLGSAIPSPRIARNPKVLIPGNSSNSRDNNEKKKNKKLKKNKDGGSSGRSEKGRNSLKRDDKSNSNSPTASPSSPKKKKRNSSISKSHLPDPPVGPQSRNKSRIRSRSGSRRNSYGSRSISAKKKINEIKANASPIGQPKQRRNSSTPKQRRGGDSHMSRRPSGSHNQRRSSDSRVQKRRSSDSYVPVSESPVAELRKKFNSNEKQDADKSPVARPAHKRGSGSYLCKINASDSPFGKDNDSHERNKSPAKRPGPRGSNDSHGPVSDSPVAQLTKQFGGNDNDEGKAPIIQPKTRTRGSGKVKVGGSDGSISELPFKQSKRRISGSRCPSKPSSGRQPKMEKRISNTSHVSESSASTKGKGRKKRASSTKGLFFDGAIIEN